MSDLKPFKHGEENTHSVCNKHNTGGKSVCCDCSGKDDCGYESMKPSEIFDGIIDGKKGIDCEDLVIKIALSHP